MNRCDPEGPGAIDGEPAATDRHGVASGIALRWYDGPRAALRRLFELAEDSPAQLDAYINDGRVLAASTGDGAVIGHLQLVATRHDSALEIKNMAVDPAWERRGIGRALVERAASTCREERVTTLTVVTAAADIGNLRFYQRVGFRFMAVERDMFTPAHGYPDGLRVDGIELRDGVRLAMDVARTAPHAVSPSETTADRRE
jgi:ribosomal protein S18 acetylase RimI-like enzyme